MLWVPARANRIAHGGFVAMVGGPEPGHLPEHAHAELQLTVHCGRKVQLIAPHEPHAGRWDAGVSVGVMLLSQTLIEEVVEDVVVRGQPCWQSRPDTADRVIDALAREVIAQFARPRDLESIGLRLAAHVVGRYGGVVLRADRSVLDSRQLARVDEYVDATLANIRVRDLAAAIGWSPRRFADAFKRTTGRTPYRHVLDRRIVAARHLLRTSKLSLAEIALRLGFASQSHFTAAFARATGTTPRAYRHG